MNIWLLMQDRRDNGSWSNYQPVGAFTSLEKMLEAIGLPSLDHPIVYSHQYYKGWWYLDVDHPKTDKANGVYYSLPAGFKYQMLDLDCFTGNKIELPKSSS